MYFIAALVLMFPLQSLGRDMPIGRPVMKAEFPENDKKDEHDCGDDEALKKLIQEEAGKKQ